VTSVPTLNHPSRPSPAKADQSSTECNVALLTGGGDKPYALGLATALTSAGILIDFIGSDDLSVPELLNNSQVQFLNLRGDQRSDATPVAKAVRVTRYYFSLIRYAASARPKIFHVLWNNKFELFDRTLLMLYYRLLGKKIVFTAHNVNAGQRDGNDTSLNRLSLRIQYRLADHIFVHTEKMRGEVVSEFRIPRCKVSVIPFGINNTVRNTDLSSTEAKRKLGLRNREKTLLFFGNIAPYKGLEYLVAAFIEILKSDDANYRLIIAGRFKASSNYWRQIKQMIVDNGLRHRIVERIEYIPDEQTELYFKAADVLILPYARIFQSGVLFLAYSLGLPVIAADVATLKEEIIEGKTGFVFKSQDSSDLAKTIQLYFESELFRDLENRRAEIKQYANERYSWDNVASVTTGVYSNLASLRRRRSRFGAQEADP